VCYVDDVQTIAEIWKKLSDSSTIGVKVNSIPKTPDRT